MNEWIKCSNKMPEAKQRVLAYCKSSRGLNRIETSFYIPPKTVLAQELFGDDSFGTEEYDEEKDCYWSTEGWYEDSWESEQTWLISDPVTHWMLLPNYPDLTSKS